jgi:hypothetical protein
VKAFHVYSRLETKKDLKQLIESMPDKFTSKSVETHRLKYENYKNGKQKLQKEKSRKSTEKNQNKQILHQYESKTATDKVDTPKESEQKEEGESCKFWCIAIY